MPRLAEVLPGEVVGRIGHAGTADSKTMGFSARNLGYMKAFAAAWPSEEILQAVPAKLPWTPAIKKIETARSTAE